ncbi:MAG: DUF1285 domain-containing protein [Pseudomonadota bacterium]
MTDLFQLAASLSDAGGDAPLPVERWHPAHCGSMDLVIKADGSWWHEGTPMTRAPLIRLFSRVLRKDDDGYVLVTPAEKISITVEDVPFLAVDFDIEGDDWIFRTNVGDVVRLDTDHPLELRSSPSIGQRAPYIRVRGGLDARLDRPVYYRMVDALEADDETDTLTVESGGASFVLPITEDS